MNWRGWLGRVGAALGVVLAVSLLAVLGSQASANAAQRPAGPARHVVIVGISGLTWNLVTKATMPELWRLAEAGSVGSLVDYAQQPLACPADGWLTLNSAARAQGPRPCTAPVVTAIGAGARVARMPQIIQDNRQYHESPNWGLLETLASCATAVGPGAALALGAPDGSVSSYLSSAGELSPSVLARCPLTVVDLGQTATPERAVASAFDLQLSLIAAELPPGTLLLVTAPGVAVEGGGKQPTGPPHLMSVVVTGPGYATGLLTSSATRRPGIVTLTDLTPTIAGWLGQSVPAGTVGARIGRADRGSLDATVAVLIARDTAEQVWIATHGWFFIGYGIAGALGFGLPALLLPGAAPERRRRRGQCWRVAGVVAAAVPLASYLANAAPWWTWAHPAWWLYGMTAAWTLVVAAPALAGPWRRDPLGPFGAVCTATFFLLAVDVMAGSRLQLEAPFGLSLLVSGRFYGIGNDALGVYSVSVLVAATWLACLAGGGPAPRLSAGRAGLPVLVASAVGLLAVVASGWPGLGAKVGGTIALVPCLLLLVVWLSGARVRGWWAVPVAVSGLVVFLVFAVVSYFLPAAGVSDIGTFAGNLLHGKAGDVLQRKVDSNVGSLTLNVFSWLIPVAALLSGAALWRPGAFRLRTLAAAFAALPVLRVLAWLCWLVLVIGWFADDSGVLVPAAALPFVVPLVIGIAAAVEPPHTALPAVI